jgi:hypothetical protein
MVLDDSSSTRSTYYILQESLEMQQIIYSLQVDGNTR